MQNILRSDVTESWVSRIGISEAVEVGESQVLETFWKDIQSVNFVTFGLYHFKPDRL